MPPRVSIVIKAFNEESNIARTIESCLAALSAIDGEIILVDSLSIDKTVEIASRYPIRIVQMLRREDCRCGTAPNIGFLNSRGSLIYLIDGDMELTPGFLPEAIDTIEKDPTLGGVGGIIHDKNLNLEFISRAIRAGQKPQRAEIDRLDGGGLYRRSAIESVAYFSDSNLHGFEEYDLGARLRSKGWRLLRVNMTAAGHFGHTMNAYRLLILRLTSGYACGAGELMRASLSSGYLTEVVSNVRTLWISALVLFWWVILFMPWIWSSAAITGPLSAMFIVAPVGSMWIRRRSFALALYAVVSWNVYAIGTIVGFLKRRRDPNDPLPCRIVRDFPVTDKVSMALQCCE